MPPTAVASSVNSTKRLTLSLLLGQPNKVVVAEGLVPPFAGRDLGATDPHLLRTRATRFSFQGAWVMGGEHGGGSCLPPSGWCGGVGGPPTTHQ